MDSTPTFPVWYLFYGTLVKPPVLKSILDLPDDEEPLLRSARIHSYNSAKWGDYPTLIPSDERSIICGRGYLVQSEEQAHKLTQYETKAYREETCRILFHRQ